MNIFKSTLKTFLVIASLFLLSCEKDRNNLNDNTLSSEINKVETKYQEGATKLETIATPGFAKIETTASNVYKAKIRKELETSYSKQTTYLKSIDNLVGVIRDGSSCGSYQELDVQMDSEDSNCQSGGTGYIGGCTIDPGGNIILRFCIVGAYNFVRTSSDFAVLDLGGNVPSDANGVTRYFDNEDSNNMNYARVDGTSFSGQYGGCNFGANTTLAFYFYPANINAPGSFPWLGVSNYIVLGRFGFSRGTIYSDDEDTGNANWLSQSPTHITGVNCTTNIITPVGNNTMIYLSRVF